MGLVPGLYQIVQTDEAGMARRAVFRTSDDPADLRLVPRAGALSFVQSERWLIRRGGGVRRRPRR